MPHKTRRQIQKEKTRKIYKKMYDELQDGKSFKEVAKKHGYTENSLRTLYYKRMIDMFTKQS